MVHVPRPNELPQDVRAGSIHSVVAEPGCLASIPKGELSKPLECSRKLSRSIIGLADMRYYLVCEAGKQIS